MISPVHWVALGYGCLTQQPLAFSEGLSAVVQMGLLSMEVFQTFFSTSHNKSELPIISSDAGSSLGNQTSTIMTSHIQTGMMSLLPLANQRLVLHKGIFFVSHALLPAFGIASAQQMISSHLKRVDSCEKYPQHATRNPRTNLTASCIRTVHFVADSIFVGRTNWRDSSWLCHQNVPNGEADVGRMHIGTTIVHEKFGFDDVCTSQRAPIGMEMSKNMLWRVELCAWRLDECIVHPCQQLDSHEADPQWEQGLNFPSANAFHAFFILFSWFKTSACCCWQHMLHLPNFSENNFDEHWNLKMDNPVETKNKKGSIAARISWHGGWLNDDDDNGEEQEAEAKAKDVLNRCWPTTATAPLHCTNCYMEPLTRIQDFPCVSACRVEGTPETCKTNLVWHQPWPKLRSTPNISHKKPDYQLKYVANSKASADQEQQHHQHHHQRRPW